MGYFSFCSSRNASAIGVSPCPHGWFGPLLRRRPLRCRCEIRSFPYCLMNATESLLPATKCPMSRFALKRFDIENRFLKLSTDATSFGSSTIAWSVSYTHLRAHETPEHL